MAASGGPPSASSSANGSAPGGLADDVDGLGAGLERDRHQRRHGDDAAGAAVAQLLREVLGAVLRVDRRDDAAQPGGRMEREHELGDVGQHHGEHVAGAEPAVGQAARDPVDQAGQLAEADGAPVAAVDQRGARAELRGAAEDDVAERRGRQHDVGIGAGDRHRATLREPRIS